MGIVDNATQAKPPQQAAGNIENAVHRIVAAGTKILYNEGVASNIVNMIKSDKSPAAGLAHASMFLLSQLTKLSKNTMPAAAKVPALKELSILIAELAQHAGVIQGDIKPVIVEARGMIAAVLSQSLKGAPAQAVPPSAPVQPFIRR